MLWSPKELPRLSVIAIGVPVVFFLSQFVNVLLATEVPIGVAQ